MKSGKGCQPCLLCYKLGGMSFLGKIFATRIQTNAMGVGMFLAGLQVYILYELNGKLYSLLTTADATTIATVFAPTIALVWMSRSFTQSKGNFRE